jgi:hypothetical protein
VEGGGKRTCIFGQGNKEIKMERSKKVYMESTASEAQSAAGLGNIKWDFDSIKRLKKPSKSQLIP